MPGSRVFLPCRSLGYVSNHIPLQVRYIKSRQENLIVTCVGKSFHTYGISHFGLLSVSRLHSGDITCLAADTYHVYTACDKVIYAWRRGTELQHTYRGHMKDVHLMIPFGPHLISVDRSSKVKIWDIKDESVYAELTFSSEGFGISAILHPSTYINQVLFGSDNGEMQLWDIESLNCKKYFDSWRASITCLEQSPALDVVAVGLSTGRIILFNIKYKETIMEFTQDWGLVTSISFRSDVNNIMATGSVCGHIVFWNLDERRVSSQLLSAHDGAVTGMVCLSREPLILTSSPDNTLKLWIFDMTDGGARLLKIREGHAAAPSSVRFHGANGHNILSCAGDSTLRIFNTQTEQFNKSLGKASYNRKISKKRGRAVQDPLIMPPITQFTSETTREKEWDNIAAIHSGIALVTTWSYDKVKMGELKLLPERFQKKNLDVNLEVVATCLCLSHCGNFVIVGYITGHVDRFNMQSGIWRDTYGNPKAHEGYVRGVATDNLNRIVITGSSDCKVKFWRFKNKALICVLVFNVDSDFYKPTCIPLSFDCKLFPSENAICWYQLEGFQVWSMLGGRNALLEPNASGEKVDTEPESKGTVSLTTLALEEPVSFFRSHRESSMLAVALEDFSINIVDYDTRRIVRIFLGHTCQLTDATFSPDSRWLVTTSMDCSIRTWDIPSGQLVDQFLFDDACVSLNMSPTGEILATAHVGHLGLFLWTNKTLYTKITLKALSPTDEMPLVTLPESRQEAVEEDEVREEEDEFVSPEQISKDLITLSGLSTSRWQNLLDIDVIKKRNKPKEPPKAPKAAPFFLPTVSSLNNIQFDVSAELSENSRLLKPLSLVNLSEFGKLLDKSNETNSFEAVIYKLKTFGPSMIDFEIKTLSPEGGGSVEVMLQFLKCIEFMLKSNQDFELGEAYLSVFLQGHGKFIAQTKLLRDYLPNIQSCQSVGWEKLQNKLFYCKAVTQHLKKT